MTRKFGVAAKAFTLVVLCVSLGSCSRHFGIVFSGYSSNIRLEFRDDALFRSAVMPTCLKELTVHELSGPTGYPSRVVWKLTSSGPCTTLTGIDIGHVPDGFKEDVRRLPLKLGRRYQADAEAD